MMILFLVLALGLLIGFMVGVVVEDAFDLVGRGTLPWRRRDDR